MKNKQNNVMNMIKDLNNHLHASNLNVPVLEGFEIKHNPNVKGCIFIATNNDGILEQLFVDRELKENETLESRIDEILKETNDYTKDKGIEIYTKLYKEYNVLDFNYKIYIQDTKINDKLIRQLDTYFINKTYNEVYKLTLAYGPFKINDNIKPLAIENDTITKKLDSMLNVILDNIKYK